MTLLHTSTVHQPDGLIEVNVYIDRKEYTYILNSKFALRQFEKFYKRTGTHGKALAILNKFKVKEDKE